MELRNGPISVFHLIFNALKVANQAFGSALSLFFIILLCFALLISILIGCNFLMGPRVMMMLSIPVGILLAFLNLIFTTAIIQILAAKMEKVGCTAWDSFSGSIVPSCYFLVSSLILGVLSFLVILCGQIAHSSWVLVFCYALVFFVSLPFMFTQQVLALRNEGPISALRYSWQLGAPHYLRLLGTLLTLGILFLIILLAAGCAVKAFAPQILTMAQYGINPIFLLQSKLQVLIVLVVVYAIVFYVYLFVQGVITGLFLNLDYSSRSTGNRQADIQPQLQEAARQTETLGSDISVTQSSIRTDSTADTAQHLDQVYKAQEHLAQAIEQEEDRMPTILFDEEMAKQLAENEEKMRRSQEEAAKNKDDNEPKSVKMSDNSL